MKQLPPGTKPEDTRKIEVEIEIDAPVEEVWPFLSTSDGLSSWYVRAELEAERAGARCTLDFGSGMIVPAFVQAYEVNDRVRLGPPPEVDSPRVEEFSVQPRDGGGCVVRVVNWGFGEGADWDAEYDAIKKGWGIFLGGLKIVVERFRDLGRPLTVQLLAMTDGAASAWEKMKAGLGAAALDGAHVDGRIEVGADIAPMKGTVYALDEHEIGLYRRDDDDGGVHLYAAVESPDGTSGMVSVTMRFFGARRTDKPAVEDAWRAWFESAF